MSDTTPTIDPRENPESKLAEDTASQTSARSGQGGAVMSDAPSAEEGAHGVIDGHITGTGDDGLLNGVKASEKDVEEAVAGDTGPEHPGERR
ncbi:hypothetical protein [Gephyromycinifex aptenodytis]|uniref:hypothetical protein n=1 Tax=Gephyromycinifex aptenodytis TaxID=2716227 RepID=UPI00144863B8|nr:hypothetical protein [Gephyromycinifex aptenodytis]